MARNNSNITIINGADITNSNSKGIPMIGSTSMGNKVASVERLDNHKASVHDNSYDLQGKNPPPLSKGKVNSERSKSELSYNKKIIIKRSDQRVNDLSLPGNDPMA